MTNDELYTAIFVDCKLPLSLMDICIRLADKFEKPVADTDILDGLANLINVPKICRIKLDGEMYYMAIDGMHNLRPLDRVMHTMSQIDFEQPLEDVRQDAVIRLAELFNQFEMEQKDD